MLIESLYIAQKQNYDYLTTQALEDGQISFRIDANLNTTYFQYISCSKDNINWETVYNENNKTSTLTVDVSAGTLVYWRGKGTTISYVSGTPSLPSTNKSGFESTCRFNVMGNVMSILFDDIDETTHQHRNPIEYDNINFTNESKYNGAFGKLFAFCTNLISANKLKLNSNIVPISGYNYMFADCTSLIDTPKLPCTNLTKHSCYWGMFKNCTSLVSGPELPATRLTSHCYREMFNGCTSLVNPPELPATNIIDGGFGNTGYAYYYMFANCTSLTNAPIINFTKLPTGSYEMFQGMFSNCKKLSYIHTKFKILELRLSVLDLWVKNVSTNGTFKMSSDAEWYSEGWSGIPVGWNIIYDGDSSIAEQTKNNVLLNIKNIALKITALEPCKVTLTSRVSKDQLNFIKYSINNGESWTTLINTYNTNTKRNIIDISLNNSDDNLLIYGDGFIYPNTTDQLQFNVTGNYKLSNYIDSLQNPYGISESCGTYYYLFNNSSTLQDITELYIRPYNYFYTFSFSNTFNNCINITDASSLQFQASTTHGRDKIFSSMFKDCSSLIYGPSFEFYSDVNNAIETNKNIFNETFKGCSSLKYIKLLLGIDVAPSNTFTKDWVEGVPEGGLFVKNAGNTKFVVSGNNGIPAGWDVSTI